MADVPHRGNHALAGALIGGTALGLGTGVAAHGFCVNTLDDGANCLVFSLGGVLVGALVGSLLGGLIGSFFPKAS